MQIRENVYQPVNIPRTQFKISSLPNMGPLTMKRLTCCPLYASVVLNGRSSHSGFLPPTQTGFNSRQTAAAVGLPLPDCMLLTQLPLLH